MDNNINKPTLGKLLVKTTTAGYTLPVENAIVHIRKYAESTEDSTELIYSLRTNNIGETPTVYLPTEPKENSLTPYGNLKVYSSYNIRIEKKGFYSVENIGIPIFEDITSIQTVELIPLSDNDKYSEYEPQDIFIENMSLNTLYGVNNEDGKGGADE